MKQETDIEHPADRWLRIARSWEQVARERFDDAPDLAARAQMLANTYLDCAEELTAYETRRRQCSGTAYDIFPL